MMLAFLIILAFLISEFLLIVVFFIFAFSMLLLLFAADIINRKLFPEDQQGEENEPSG